MADEEKSEEVTEEVVEATAEETAQEETAAPEENAAPEGAETAPAGEGGEEAATQEKKSDKPRTAEDIFLELEGSDGVEKAKVVKAKGSKNIQNGVVHVSASFNNTIVSVSDASGNVIGWSSSGKMGFRGSRKSTAYAAQLVSQDACRQAMSHGLKQAEVRVKGPGAGRESAVRAVQGLGIDVIRIMDVTPVPHNGCRPKKARRV